MMNKQVNFLTINYPCKISQLGFKIKKSYYIPVKDINGISKDKFLKISEDSKLFNLINNSSDCYIIEK